MAHTTREESQEGEHLKRALLPTRAEVGALLAVSSLLLVAANAFPAIKSFRAQDYALVTDYIRQVVEKILAPTNNQAASRILTVIFWMFIGMVAYILVWMFVSLYSNYRNDVVDTKGMVMPREFKKDAAWHETLLKFAIRAIATIIFLYWIYVLLATILPYASTLFLTSFNEFDLRSAASIALSVLIVAASFFLAIIFARCIVLRERVFTS